MTTVVTKRDIKKKIAKLDYEKRVLEISLERKEKEELEELDMPKDAQTIGFDANPK